MSALIRILSLAVVALVLSLPASGYAQGSAVERAIELADRAGKARAEGRLKEAFGLYQQAHAALPAPTMLFNMGACKEELGELTRARALYREATNMDLPEPPPPPYVEAQDNARAALAKLEARMPKLNIVVEGATGDVAVTVDGELVSPEELAAHPVDPGEHAVKAQRPGAPPVTRTVQARAGEETEVVLAFAGEPGADTASPPVPGWVPWSLIGVGGASLAVGAITGAVTLARASDFEEECGGTENCDPALEERVEANETLGNVSTATFVIGGVLAAAGVALLVVNWTDEEAGVSFGPTGFRIWAAF